MPTPINRTQLRQETHRSGFVGNITSDEAASVVLRRNGASDYRLAIDDVSINNSIDGTTSAVNANTTATTSGAQKSQIVASNGTTNLSINGSGAASVTISGTPTVTMSTTQYNAIITLLTRVADAVESINTKTPGGV